MKIPHKNSVAGKVLRLMLDGQARSKLQITDELGLHPAKEVTARLRDFRKPIIEGGLDMKIDHHHHRDKAGNRIDVYRVAYAPRWVRDAVKAELADQREGVAA